MNSLCSEDDWDWDWDPEYYFLPPNEVARVVYDEDGEEYAISEAMGPEGVWFDCDVDRILADGRPISEAEAMEMVDGFGGEW